MRLGILGGTGAAALLDRGTPVEVSSGPWGAISAVIRQHRIGRHDVFFLPRHGWPGSVGIAPHRVNYRANVWAMGELKVDHLLGLNAVGTIAANLLPGALVLPTQLIDYTWGREHSYAGAPGRPLQHVEFTEPFCARFRGMLESAAGKAGVPVHLSGVYGVTQGPRLETAAEIDRLERDGCSIVGMTAMPEAGLARELSLSYAIVCLAVNRAAGRGPSGQGIHAEIEAYLEMAVTQVRRLLAALLD